MFIKLFFIIAFSNSISYVAKSESTVENPQPIEVHGHRGARSIFPENTLAAFEYALEQGVNVLELDLGVTRDGILVIYHDQKINPSLCRFKDGRRATKIAIRTLTLNQIKQYDCGSLPNRKFPRQRAVPGAEIPTLNELFALIESKGTDNARSVQFNIEIKSDASRPDLQPPPAEFAKLVFEVIREHEMIARVIIQSFDHRALIEMKKLDSQIRTSALFNKRPRGDFVQIVQNLKAFAVSPKYRWLKRRDVRQFHDVGIQVIPWTVNEPKGWRKMLDLGVDGIISDDPAALIKFLKK